MLAFKPECKMGDEYVMGKIYKNNKKKVNYLFVLTKGTKYDKI